MWIENIALTRDIASSSVLLSALCVCPALHVSLLLYARIFFCQNERGNSKIKSFDDFLNLLVTLLPTLHKVLCMKNAGTQWTMVSYFKRISKN